MLKHNVLINTIRNIKRGHRIALCGYFLIGYPTPEKFLNISRASLKLDIFEFGIPSENPLFDGPVIARAHDIVINERGVQVESALALLSAVKNTIQPRFVMTYSHDGRSFNGFFRMCIENHVHGIFAPDIDDSESKEVKALARSLNIAYVSFVTTDMDQYQIMQKADLGDIIYIKAGASKTGQIVDFESQLKPVERIVTTLRKYKKDLIISVGIGIQEPVQVRQLAALNIDMVIVGTKIMEHLEKSESDLLRYIEQLYDATYIL